MQHNHRKQRKGNSRIYTSCLLFSISINLFTKWQNSILRKIEENSLVHSLQIAKKIISQSHITPQQNDPIHLIVHPANQWHATDEPTCHWKTKINILKNLGSHSIFAVLGELKKKTSQIRTIITHWNTRSRWDGTFKSFYWPYNSLIGIYCSHSWVERDAMRENRNPPKTLDNF